MLRAGRTCFVDYEFCRFLVQCRFRGAAFSSGGRVGPSSPEVVVPVVHVSFCMRFFLPVR